MTMGDVDCIMPVRILLDIFFTRIIFSESHNILLEGTVSLITALDGPLF